MPADERHPARLDDLQRDVLAALHADPGIDPASLATRLDADEGAIQRALARLEELGHVERDGDLLRPAGGTHTTPGLFVPSERPDAAPVEADGS